MSRLLDTGAVAAILGLSRKGVLNGLSRARRGLDAPAWARLSWVMLGRHPRLSEVELQRYIDGLPSLGAGGAT